MMGLAVWEQLYLLFFWGGLICIGWIIRDIYGELKKE